MHSTQVPNLQSLLQHKDILVHPPLYTILPVGLGKIWYQEKTGKQAFCLTLLTGENTLMHTFQEGRCQNEVNIILSRPFPTGSAFGTSLEPEVFGIRARLKYTMAEVQQ